MRPAPRTQKHRPSTVVVIKKPKAAKPQRVLPTAEEKAAKQAAHVEHNRAAQEAALRRYFDSCWEILEVMGERWPAIFAPDATTRPLAIGVAKEIVAALPEFTQRRVQLAIHFFFRRWTVWREYHAALAQGGPRYGLDGKEYGIVSSEEQEAARKVLSEF